MTDESEFARFRQVYLELQERVERLSRYHQMYDQVRERLGDLNRQVEDLVRDADMLGLERACANCGEVYLDAGGVPCPQCGHQEPPDTLAS